MPQFAPLNGLQQMFVPYESVQYKQSACIFVQWNFYGKMSVTFNVQLENGTDAR